MVVLVSLGISATTSGVEARARVRVGFSFSPDAARYRGEDPGRAFDTLLGLNPDVVRLPVYWKDVAAVPGRLDYGVTDSLLQQVRRHNQSAASPTLVILDVGARELGYPEVWAPARFLADPNASVESMEASREYQTFFSTTVARYAHEPLLTAWQVENEPLDTVTTPRKAPNSLSAIVLGQEIAALKRIDARHPVIVTTFNSSSVDLDQIGIANPNPAQSGATYLPAGHPEQALRLADILGLDVYVVEPNTDLHNASAARRIGWKREALNFWAQRAASFGKQLWIMEMEAEPFPHSDAFTPNDLIAEADNYVGSGANTVLLWGVEQWLVTPQWMAAGRQAFAILHGQTQ